MTIAPQSSPSPRDRLIVALDLPSVAEAERMVDQLGDAVTFYKVGLELAFAGGLQFATALARSGRQLFLDLKLHDIPTTVERATRQVADLGATFLTVHAYPQTLAAAVRGRAGHAGTSGLKILGVTVMTSYGDADLLEAGYADGVAATVERRARQAEAAGADGLIISAEEAARIRGLVGPRLQLVTPGIRPAGTASQDQKRVMTPGDAIRAGADYLVVGRPVTAAADPAAAARAIVAEIQSAS
ncbi:MULTISPECIES: orotidine-5'-phosphate decarboxylase [unclassified Chelatococcus]|uniref:orotidine-5'-phosphate decarboxylase n=1 Tax=unclassified Chelatococcus TaxID=2638111 RepID=UPI00224BCFB9|nr:MULTISPECIES: orotidine-5'-phosphate decarboxylase [unclassified Chelatococcus]CAH1661701.1 Orotidine 5'-phosphate decarboxylase [Hyphomicrobiales bacterium]CAH1683014.1 Orotidine 5'-phosphate decarboxylase [Hyphomicrobiales bacterium]